MNTANITAAKLIGKKLKLQHALHYSGVPEDYRILSLFASTGLTMKIVAVEVKKGGSIGTIGIAVARPGGLPVDHRVFTLNSLVACTPVETTSRDVTNVLCISAEDGYRLIGLSPSYLVYFASARGLRTKQSIGFLSSELLLEGSGSKVYVGSNLGLLQLEYIQIFLGEKDPVPLNQKIVGLVSGAVVVGALAMLVSLIK
jgi:hypothetical protein